MKAHKVLSDCCAAATWYMFLQLLFQMSDEQDKLKLKIEQAEAAAARAEQAYEEAEPGPVRDSCLQLLLAKEASLLADKKALEQV